MCIFAFHNVHVIFSFNCYFQIATIVFSWYNRVKFDPVWFDSIYEKVICDYVVNEVQPLIVNPGRFLLTNKTLYFQPFNNIMTFPVIKIRLKFILSVMKRRFMLKQIVSSAIFLIVLSDIFNIM